MNRKPNAFFSAEDKTNSTLRADQDARIGTSNFGVYYGPKTKQAATRRVEKRNGLSHTTTKRFFKVHFLQCVVGTAKKRLTFWLTLVKKHPRLAGAKTETSET